MDRFPAEFEDLLNRRGRTFFADPPQLEALIARRKAPIVVFQDLIDDDVASDCIRLLDQALYPSLHRMHFPIPREAVTEMTENYKEALGKTMRVKTAMLNGGRSRAVNAADEIGLTAMMRSKSFVHAAQALTKHNLNPRLGRQVICYEQGDYSGPHNDHHPENEESRNGFVDFHLMFSNEGVKHQSLVYEERRFLSAAYDVSARSGIAVYRLPFWHYTTPLAVHPGAEATARRWLLLGSFDYDPPLEKLEYW